MFGEEKCGDLTMNVDEVPLEMPGKEGDGRAVQGLNLRRPTGLGRGHEGINYLPDLGEIPRGLLMRYFRLFEPNQRTVGVDQLLNLL
mgnify:CR=1 FL=1